MWKFFPEIAIHPSACYSTKQRYKNYKSSATDLGKKWSRTSARHSPAKTKYSAANDLALIEFLVMKLNVFTVNRFDLEFFYKPN